MTSQRRGANTVVLVAVLVGVVAVGLVAWYFVSDVFRTKVDATAEQWTRWTPENIARDPVNYLNFVEAQTKASLERLKADRISIAQTRARLETMKEKAQERVRAGQQTLLRLKEAYEKAAEAKSWPAMYEGQSKTEDWFKTNIVSLFGQMQSQQAIIERVDGGLKTLDAQVSKILKAEADAAQQLAEIATNRELLSVQKITDDVKNRLVSMRAAVQGVVAVAGESESVLTLDQLVARSEATVSETAFEKALQSIK